MRGNELEPKCPKCGSETYLWQQNERRYREPAKRYRCKVCGFSFTVDATRMRHAPATVARAVELYRQHSLRDIAVLLKKEFGVSVSAPAVREWIISFYEKPRDDLGFLEIPCFSCFVLHEAEARKCDPTACMKLDYYILST